MEPNELNQMTPHQLGESGNIEAISYLIDFLDKGKTNDRKLAASGIRKLIHIDKEACNRAIPSLLTCLDKPGLQTRQYALKTLEFLDLDSESLQKIKNFENEDTYIHSKTIAKRILSKSDQENTKANLMQFSWFYDATGYYAYILLKKLTGDITSEERQKVRRYVEQVNAQVIMDGRSHRPASNGIQYEHYFRVVGRQNGQKPSRSSINKAMLQFFKAIPASAPPEKHRQSNLLSVKEFNDLKNQLEREKNEKKRMELRLNTIQKLYDHASNQVNKKDKVNLILKEQLQTVTAELNIERQNSIKKISIVSAEYEAKLQKIFQDDKKIEMLQADLKNAERESSQLQTKLDEQESELAILEQVAIKEQEELKSEISLYQEELQIIENCRDQDIMKAEMLAQELLEMRLSYDNLQRQMALAAMPQNRLAEDFRNFLTCLLPNLEIWEESIDFLLVEVQNYSKILSELYKLNFTKNKASLGHKPVKTADKWWEITKISIGPGHSHSGRIYYKKIKGQNKYSVLISHKKLQDSRDIPRLRSYSS